MIKEEMQEYDEKETNLPMLFENLTYRLWKNYQGSQYIGAHIYTDGENEWREN